MSLERVPFSWAAKTLVKKTKQKNKGALCTQEYYRCEYLNDIDEKSKITTASCHASSAGLYNTIYTEINHAVMDYSVKIKYKELLVCCKVIAN